MQQSLSVPFGALLFSLFLFLFFFCFVFCCCFKHVKHSLTMISSCLKVITKVRERFQNQPVGRFQVCWKAFFSAVSYRALHKFRIPVKKTYESKGWIIMLLVLTQFFCIVSMCAGQQHGGLKFAWGSHLTDSFPFAPLISPFPSILLFPSPAVHKVSDNVTSEWTLPQL